MLGTIPWWGWALLAIVALVLIVLVASEAAQERRLRKPLGGDGKTDERAGSIVDEIIKGGSIVDQIAREHGTVHTGHAHGDPAPAMAERLVPRYELDGHVVGAGMQISRSAEIETERETDGRWLAEAPDVPGAMAYGGTEADAKARALAIAAVARGEAGEHGGPIAGLGDTPPLKVGDTVTLTRRRRRKPETLVVASVVTGGQPRKRKAAKKGAAKPKRKRAGRRK